MKEIKINVADKVASAIGSPVIVCGNSNYKITFIFDSEWGAYQEKTARFTFRRDGIDKYIDVLFSGSSCTAPILTNIERVSIGVYAGDLRTTTGADIRCKKSILCRGGLKHEQPPEDVYNEILETVSKKLGSEGGTVTGDYFKDGNTFIHEGNLDLLDETDNLAITKTASGSAITIDSAKAPLQNLKLFGKTEQNGTPTPDAPVPLVSVGDSGSFEVGVYRKNLLPNQFKVGNTYTANGINYYINTDGSISVSGTPTSTTAWSSLDARHHLGGNALFVLPKGRYKYVCEGMKDTYKLYPTLYRIDVSGTVKEFVKLYKITETFFEITNEKDTLYLLIGCVPNYTPQGERLYISIVPETETDLSYEPYNKQTLTMPYTLRSMGEVKDEVDFNRATHTRNVIDVFKSDFNIGLHQYTNNDYWVVTVSNTGAALSSIGLCSHLEQISSSDLGKKTGFYIYAIANGLSPVHISLPKTVASDITALKQWIIDNNVRLCYPLATPIETPLTETELNAYRQLMTNKGTTNILSEAEAEVDYYINKPNAQAIGNIHSQVNEDYFKLQQAIISLGGSTL